MEIGCPTFSFDHTHFGCAGWQIKQAPPKYQYNYNKIRILPLKQSYQIQASTLSRSIPLNPKNRCGGWDNFMLRILDLRQLPKIKLEVNVLPTCSRDISSLVKYAIKNKGKHVNLMVYTL